MPRRGRWGGSVLVGLDLVDHAGNSRCESSSAKWPFSVEVSLLLVEQATEVWAEVVGWAQPSDVGREFGRFETRIKSGERLLRLR